MWGLLKSKIDCQAGYFSHRDLINWRRTRQLLIAVTADRCMRTATTTTGSSHSRSCREDAHGASGPVWDELRIVVCRERMFRAVASIGAGKWRQKKEQALAASKACVAVIGRRWADATNLPRLQDPPACGRHPAGSDPR
jgi:hypothetical protein